MTNSAWRFWVIFGVLLCTEISVFGQNLATNPKDTFDFQSHDIGTTTPVSIPVTNLSGKSLNLQVTLSNTLEFSWASGCLSGLQPGKSCDITVSFSPKYPSSAEKPTQATLQISDSTTSPATLQLKGISVANLRLSPDRLEFGNQLVGASSSPRAITVSNYTQKNLSNVVITATGDFSETHSGCETLNAGASCAISIVLTPKHLGAATGAITVAASPTDAITTPRTVNLSGVGVLQCNPLKLSCGLGTWIVVVLCGAYFLGLVLVRWNMIAKPARLQLRTQIMAVQTRLNAEFAALPHSEKSDARKTQIEELLKGATYVIKTKHDPFDPWRLDTPPWYTRYGNALFWTRGHELAGWSLVHEAEEQLVALLPLERVRARMETAEQQLREMNTPGTLALADRLRDATQSGDVILQDRLRKLLAQTSILQQSDVPAAAQKVLLDNSMCKVAGFLNSLIAWLGALTSPATVLADCQKSLTEFQQKFSNWTALQQEIEKILQQWPGMSEPHKTVLQSASGFLAGQFAAVYGGAGTQPDLSACNTALGSLSKLQSTAQSLVAQFAALVQKDQDVTTLKAFLQKSATQTDLLTAIAAALAPLKSAELLQQILTILDSGNDLSQQVAGAASAASTDDVSKLRPFLATFAFSLPIAQELTARIKCELERTLTSVLSRWHSLLIEALGMIYDRADTDFSQLANWHNKLMWLVGLALIFILALAITFQNPVLLLLGAVGGLLSRLTRNLDAADVENDYGASWGALFLSPVTGALSAWGGILLIILGNKLSILGSALNLDWCNPYEPIALAISLLFGFSERLFDQVAEPVIKKVLSPSSSPTPAPAATPSPTISAVDPLQASAGKESKLNVRGTNFKAGASASFTDQAGKPVSTLAAVDFKDASNLIVAFTPSGATKDKWTLTITNPDGKAATFPSPIQIN